MIHSQDIPKLLEAKENIVHCRFDLAKEQNMWTSINSIKHVLLNMNNVSKPVKVDIIKDPSMSDAKCIYSILDEEESTLKLIEYSYATHTYSVIEGESIEEQFISIEAFIFEFYCKDDTIVDMHKDNQEELTYKFMNAVLEEENHFLIKLNKNNIKEILIDIVSEQYDSHIHVGYPTRSYDLIIISSGNKFELKRIPTLEGFYRYIKELTN